MNTLIITAEKTITVMLPTMLDEDGRPTTLVIDKEIWDDGIIDRIPSMSPSELIITFDNRSDEQKRDEHYLKLYESGIGGVEFKQMGSGVFHHADVSGLSVPRMLFFEMMDALESGDDDRYLSLKLFWMRCALNHNPQSRDDLFEFIKGNGFFITPTGMLCTFRNVVELPLASGKDKSTLYPNLFSFLRESVAKVVRWKKSTNNFIVYGGRYFHAPHYKIIDVKKGTKPPKGMKKIGKLSKLWKNAQKNAVFTDAHTKTFEIRMKQVVEIERAECDYNNNESCSYGLHVGSPSFIKDGSFGNVSIAVLVNPTDVVAVPSYNRGKMRVCRYLPLDFVDQDNICAPKNLSEIKYSRKSLKSLNHTLMNSTVEELQQHRLMPQELSLGVFNQIRGDISKIKDVLNDRLIKI